MTNALFFFSIAEADSTFAFRSEQQPKTIKKGVAYIDFTSSSDNVWIPAALRIASAAGVLSTRSTT